MDDGASEDTAVGDAEPAESPSRTAVLLRTVGAALGTMSAAVIVIGVGVVALFVIICGGFWLLVETFTTVGS